VQLLLVPPDTRPPTLAFPAALARSVGWTVQTPPPEALPAINQPGDFKALKAWLLAAAPRADVLIVSLETLTLGGMIPARRVNTPLETVLERLKLLRELKARHPGLSVLAHGVVVRVAHDDDPVEEKDYYGLYGAGLRRYSEAFDRFSRHGGDEHERALLDALAEVPRAVLEDWLGTRERNHQLHLAALEGVREGVVDHLCLTLDDTSPCGLAAADRRALEARADALALWDRVDIYPGADEVPLTLLARALQRGAPTRVYVRYSGAMGAAAGLLYEDRPAGELVKAHLRAAGCVPVDTLAEAAAAEGGGGFVLAVNVPGIEQAGTQPDVAVVDTPHRHLPEFVDFVGRCLEAGVRVSVADIAYPNGAEARLMALLDHLPLAQVSFSAWNTAGNTLGSALALGVAASHVQDPARWTQVRFNRLVDDALYQGVVRAAVHREMGEPSPFDLGARRAEAERRIDALLEPKAKALWERHFAATGMQLVWHPAKLAWPRLFTGVFPLEVHDPT
jgi:hypothetical protein